MLQFLPKCREREPLPAQLAALDINPKLLELLLDRGLDTPEKISAYLNPCREDLHDPLLMQDMDRAVAVIRDAIKRNEEIVVFGDYDVDGVTATAILLTYLRKQGATVSFYIPDRHGEGYGLNMAAVEQIASHARLLITVDCGITCPQEVRRARELGMRVIVTDHHQLGPEMPECEAVLNPLLGEYPFRRLCGAGVDFKLVQALGGEEAIAPLWELAALATIADIVPLLGENRVIVANGLADMAVTKRPGLIALMESAGVEAKSVSSSDVAFRMAPRINAGGRLALASRGVELLTTRRLDTAREIAEELNQDNTKRRELELDIFAQADDIVQREIDFREERVIVVSGEGWNPGVIGLAASRMVEKYKWPTVLLAQQGDVCVGSARSIPGVNIHQALSACRDLFVRFGGHAQAAGLTIKTGLVPELRRRLSQVIREQAAPEAFIPTEEYDLELELSDMTEELVESFSAMQPTGFGNPAPVFCVRGVNTADVRTIGKEGAHLRLRLVQGSDMRNAVAFRMGERARSMPEIIEAVLTLSINVWQERRSVQCELRQFQAYLPPKAFLSECQRREGELDAAMLRALSEGSAAARESGPDTQPMTLEAAMGTLRDELLTGYQGTLLCVHSIPALKMANIHLAIIHAQLDYAVFTLSDQRMFNTLLMAPDWENIHCNPRAVVMLDGFVSDAERHRALARFPEARFIEMTGLEQQTAAAAAGLLPQDDALRGLYRVLRQREQMATTLPVLAAQAGMSESMALCGLYIFRELGLAEFAEQPFSCRLLPSGKVSLERSAVRGRLRELAAARR